MKKVRFNIVILVFVIGLMNALCFSVSATESCSITVNTFDVQDASLPIPGVQVTLYHIAALSDDNSIRYVNTAEFNGFTGDLSWSDSSDCAELADQLASYAEQQKIQGITQTTSTKGLTEFVNLEKGLYLIVQTGKQPKNYKMFVPGLVEVPFYDSDQFVYHVNIYPKLDDKPTPTPTIPIKSPDTPGGGDLPDTGMLLWPIPVLAVSGCSLLLIGGAILLISRKKGDSDEK